MFTPEFRSDLPPITFREIPPLLQWSEEISYLDTPYEEFISTALATALDLEHRFTGTLTRNAHTGNVTSFTHTRFRRNKYGPPPDIEDCSHALSALAARFNTTSHPNREKAGLARIVLGLYEGQHDTGAPAEDTPHYTWDSVAEQLGDHYTVSPCEVFSTRLDLKNNHATYYAEASAQVLLPDGFIPRMYVLADAMAQERISVEIFGVARGRSYMVETWYCKDPDPVRPVAD